MLDRLLRAFLVVGGVSVACAWTWPSPRVPEDNAADWELSCASGRRGVISKSEGIDRIYRGTVWSWRNDSTQRSLYENI